MKQVIEEFGGSLIHTMAGSSMVAIFVYLIEKLLA